MIAAILSFLSSCASVFNTLAKAYQDKQIRDAQATLDKHAIDAAVIHDTDVSTVARDHVDGMSDNAVVNELRVKYSRH